MGELNGNNDGVKAVPLGKRIWMIVLALLSFFPSAYAFGAVVQLILDMGHGVGSYAYFGRTAGEVVQAWAVMLFYAVWLMVGIIVAVKVLIGQWALRCLVIQTILAWLLILPSNAFYLLALAHV